MIESMKARFEAMPKAGRGACIILLGVLAVVVLFGSGYIAGSMVGGVIATWLCPYC